MKILIADDDADDRHFALMALKELNSGHDIDFVRDGQELMDHLDNQINCGSKLPDVIILDSNMPKKDGKTALTEIKRHPELKHIDVYVFSTSSSRNDIRLNLELGAKNYFVKPSQYEELLGILESICGNLVLK